MSHIDILVEAMDGRMPKVRNLEEALSDWELRPIHYQDNIAAILLVKGAEVHVAALKAARGKWLSRAIIKANLLPILDEYGYAETSVMRDNDAGQEFVTRLGFKEISSTSTVIKYKLENLNYA